MAKTYYMRWIAVLLLAVSTQSKADEWTKTDTAWQSVFTIMQVVDWGQTLNIADSCYQQTAKNHTTDYCQYYEKNILLGTRPSRSEINTYFSLTLIAHAAISYWLPPSYRRPWQMFWIGVEAGTVAKNIKVGVNFSF